jgi:hypothetical protein
MNDVHLIKILDQRLDLSAMQLCLGLNPTALHLFLSYPSIYFDLMADENLGDRDLRSHPLLILSFHLNDPMVMKTLEADPRSRI